MNVDANMVKTTHKSSEGRPHSNNFGEYTLVSTPLLPVRRTAEQHDRGQAQGHFERRGRPRGSPDKEPCAHNRQSRRGCEDGRQAYAVMPQVGGTELSREEALLAQRKRPFHDSAS